LEPGRCKAQPDKQEEARQGGGKREGANEVQAEIKREGEKSGCKRPSQVEAICSQTSKKKQNREEAASQFSKLG